MPKQASLLLPEKETPRLLEDKTTKCPTCGGIIADEAFEADKVAYCSEACATEDINNFSFEDLKRRQFAGRVFWYENIIGARR